MGRDKRNERSEQQFTKWVKAHRALPAWKALGFPAREVYFHLQIRCFAETSLKNSRVANNNGDVFRSPRALAEDIGCNPKTVMSALADLQAKGWIVCTQLGSLGIDGKGETAKFRLTMFPTANGRSIVPATREPTSWSEDYPILAYAPYKPKGRKGQKGNLKKQNPAPECGAGLSQNVVQERSKMRFPAPECGAEMPPFSSIPAPECGAYLTTISQEKLRHNIQQGIGLCGRAIREAA